MNLRKRDLVMVFLIVITTMGFISATEISDDTSSELNVGTVIYCNRGTEWINYPGLLKENSSEDCYMPESVNITCCPNGYYCNITDTSFNSICMPSTPGARMCWDFNQDECAGRGTENSEFVKNSALFLYNKVCNTTFYQKNGKTCWDTTKCSCSWSGSKCNLSITNYSDCEGDILQPEETCSWSLETIDDRCESEGVQHWTFTGNPSAGYTGADCPPEKTVDVPCESIVKLPFFNMYNFISVLIVLIFIYSFFIFKKSIVKDISLSLNSQGQTG